MPTLSKYPWVKREGEKEKCNYLGVLCDLSFSGLELWNRSVQVLSHSVIARDAFTNTHVYEALPSPEESSSSDGKERMAAHLPLAASVKRYEKARPTPKPLCSSCQSYATVSCIRGWKITHLTVRYKADTGLNQLEKLCRRDRLRQQNYYA